MEIERWDSTWGELNEENFRRRLESDGYRVSTYVYPPGTFFPDHRHAMDKKDAVLAGVFKMKVRDREFILRAGDALFVPAGAVHSAEVLGDEPVISLDASRTNVII